MELKKNNAYAAIIVLALLTALFTGMYVALPIYGDFYTRFMNETKYSAFSNEADCIAEDGFWGNGECQPLKDRPMQIINHNRKVWLIAPIIFAVGLIFWLITISLKQDPQDYYFR